MSLVLKATGGGSITLQEPTTASDFTLNFPAAAGVPMVSGNMPAFSAYRTTTQSISSNTWTKIQFNVEEFDTNNNYDPTTNYRFTPTVAGYYQISAAWANSNTSSYNYVAIYKNGSANKMSVGNGANGVGAAVSGLIYFNGTTDYVEGYAFTDAGSISASSANCFFTGVLVRAA